MKLLTLLSVFWFSLSAATLADVTFSYTVQNGKVSLHGVGQVGVKGDAALITRSGLFGEPGSPKKGKDILYNGKTDQLFVIDHDAKVTTVVESPKRGGPKVPSQAEQDETVKHLTPEQEEAYRQAIELTQKQRQQFDHRKERKRRTKRRRKRFRQNLKREGSLAVGSAEVVGGGAWKAEPAPDYNGYSVTRWKRDNKEVLVTDWSNLTLSDQSLVDTLADMASFYDEVRSDPEWEAYEKLMGESTDFLEALSQGDGLPIRRRRFTEDGVKDDWSLESTTERDLDPDAFEPPPGYRRRTMGGFFQ